MPVEPDNGLIPGLGNNSHYFYPEPNPRLSEILMSHEVRDLVDEWGLKVELTYIAALQGRKRSGDRHPGAMENAIEGRSLVGGYKHDRWIGELTVHVPYALADEFGRKQPAPGQHDSVTPAHHTLRDALYANLPQI